MEVNGGWWWVAFEGVVRGRWKNWRVVIVQVQRMRVFIQGDEHKKRGNWNGLDLCFYEFTGSRL